MTGYTHEELETIIGKGGNSAFGDLAQQSLDALVALGWTPPPREEPLTAGMVLFRAMQHQTDEAEVKKYFTKLPETLENECWERAARAVIDWAKEQER